MKYWIQIICLFIQSIVSKFQNKFNIEYQYMNSAYNTRITRSVRSEMTIYTKNPTNPSLFCSLLSLSLLFVHL